MAVANSHFMNSGLCHFVKNAECNLIALAATYLSGFLYCYANFDMFHIS